MYNFEYRRPGSLSEAASAIQGASEGKLLAGGQTLLATMKQRLASPSDLIDLSGITELKGISTDGETLVIGAMTTHAEVANSDVVKSHCPALATLAGGIGDPQVRHCGTIGGSIANADPAADYPAAIVGLGATVVTNSRQINADSYFTGLFETALQDGEIITQVRFPKPQRAGYAKFANPASRYAIVGVFVSQGSGETRVAVTGAGPSAFRVAEMEQALAGNFSSDALNGISVGAGSLNSDIHASADYRAHLVGVMAKRAVASAS